MDQVGEFRIELHHGQLTLGPCPLCGARTRHPKRRDPRLACNVYGDRTFCFECGMGIALKDIGVELSEEQVRQASKGKPLMEKDLLERFWNYCHEVHPTSPGYEYLCQRFNKRDLVFPQELVRHLPDYIYETDWIKGWKQKYRLIFPLRDESGNMRNVIARSLAQKPKIKSMSFRGFARHELCLIHRRDPQTVVFCEGEVDWLAWCLFGPDDATVYGIFAGAIPEQGPSVVDDHRFADVLLATDLDEAGDKYADEIRKRLHSTCEVRRWAPQMNKVNDACDVVRKGGVLEFEGLL